MGPIADLLASAGIENAAREAAWILADASTVAEARSLALRRAQGEPLQYVLGSVAFRHLTLKVGPGAFIPRPETEIVAGRAIELLREAGTDEGVAIDLCTGSGAIALALAHECPRAKVFGTEISAPALEWAKRNGGSYKVSFLQGSLFEPLPVSLKGTVDVVVSNPPYIAFDEAEVLPPEVIDHEPHEALFASGDGLDVIRSIASQTRSWLREGGALVLEIGETQGPAAREILDRADFKEIEVSPDLAGKDRIVEGRIR